MDLQRFVLVTNADCGEDEFVSTAKGATGRQDDSLRPRVTASSSRELQCTGQILTDYCIHKGAADET